MKCAKGGSSCARFLLCRLAAAAAAAAFFVSGCHYHMPPHAEMEGRVSMASGQVSKADRAGYTVATVEKALRLYDSKGREATLAYYNSPESVDGEWYVVIADENKEIIAHPNPDVSWEKACSAPWGWISPATGTAKR